MVEDPEERAQEHSIGYKRWMDETFIRSRSVQDLDPSTISKLLDRLPSAHHLDGVSSGDCPPILVFRFQENVPRATLTSDRLGFFTWGWPGRFGACMTITAYVRPHGWISRISLDQDAEAFRQLESGRCVAVFAKDGGIITAFDINFSATPFAREQFSKHWNTVACHKATVRDAGAMYWEVIRNNDTLSPHLTLHDKLSSSWIRAFLIIADHAHEALTELSDSAIIREYRTVSLPETAVHFLDTVAAANKSVTRIYEYFTASLQEDGWLVRFLKELKALYEFDLPPENYTIG